MIYIGSSSVFVCGVITVEQQVIPAKEKGDCKTLTKGAKNGMKNWKLWYRCAGIRALKTVCQTAVSIIGVSSVISEVDWLMVGSASLLAGVLSILTSLAGIPEAEEG